MKFTLPAALAFLTIACVAPPAKPGTEAHQRQLAEEARKNFYALKEQERKSRPPVVVAEAEPPPIKVRLTPFQTTRPAEVEKPAPVLKPAPPMAHYKPAKPVPTPKAAKPSSSLSLFARHERPQPADQTLYLYDMPHGPEPDSPRYRAYKIQYARELAKRPEDLSSEEREWVRRHYRDH